MWKDVAELVERNDDYASRQFIETARLFAPMHLYEVRPRKDKRGVDLISDVLPFGRLYSSRMQSVIAL